MGNTAGYNPFGSFFQFTLSESIIFKNAYIYEKTVIERQTIEEKGPDIFFEKAFLKGEF